MTPDDALKACASGERTALRWLYEQEAAKMLGVALRMVKRRALAEELVQDCFVAIWRGAHSYDPARGQARTWMYAILRNRALNLLRGEARLELSGHDADENAIAEEATPEEAMLASADRSALARCMSLLDEVRRRMLILAYTEGLTHIEIANRLKTPLGTVKSSIRRSLASLRECLG